MASINRCNYAIKVSSLSPVPTLQKVLDRGSEAAIEKDFKVSTTANIELEAQETEVKGELESKQFTSAFVALSIDAGTVEWDLSQGMRASLEITENVQLNLTNISDIATLHLEVKQANGGGHILTFDSNIVANVDNVNLTDGLYTNYAFLQNTDGKYRGAGLTFDT